MMSSSRAPGQELSIAIVGGGPRCTYALERLAASLPKIAGEGRVRVHIFERTGLFGDGQSHGDVQLHTSLLNRVAAQLGLGADESNVDARHLLATDQRITFLQWCHAKHAESGDERFVLGPERAVPRYLHGMALRELLGHYIEILEKLSGVTVEQHAEEVVDLLDRASSGHHDESGDIGSRLRLVTASNRAVSVDRVLFVTGHSWNAAPEDEQSLIANEVGTAPSTRFPYPVARTLARSVVPPGATVGVRGLGLTAIDVCLAFTEGRGGRFSTMRDERGSSLVYHASGDEPAAIVCFSPSGVPPFTRPDNAKWQDPARLEHRGRFFTISAIEALRAAVGRPAMVGTDEAIRQLDFERHVFPLVVLEMAYIYYRTLFGPVFGDYVAAQVTDSYQAFLRGSERTRDESIEELLGPVERCVDRAAGLVEQAFTRGMDATSTQYPYLREVVQSFCRVVWGRSDRPPEPAASPWGHPRDVNEHRFSWRAIFEPLRADRMNGGEWQGAVVELLKRDLCWAEQNNLRNPVKAACDGAWRDLRAVFRAAVDRGGLLPESQRVFDALYLRYYRRLSNGATRESVGKLIALLEHGVVDISIGPDPQLTTAPAGRGYIVRGPHTCTERKLDMLVEGHLHPFDVRRDHRPLYRNLSRRGLVRAWRNPGQAGEADYVPGALDLDRDFHPRDRDGVSDPRVTFLGAPAERLCYFQMTLARPMSNSEVINDVARWATGVCEAMAGSGHVVPVSDRTAGLRRPTAPPITGIRERIRSLVCNEIWSERQRDIIILAVDGVRHGDARRWWPSARNMRMSSVFPTTSASAWMSSASGTPVDVHGVPGVVFPDDSGELINIFHFKGALPPLHDGNLFSDAAALGYDATAVLGDLRGLDCSWRDRLVENARVVPGSCFYAVPPGSGAITPEALTGSLDEQVAQVQRRDRPRFIWIFVDLDQYIHRHGYDDYVASALTAIEHVALDWTRRYSALVVAYSDHGLVPSVHDPHLQALVEEIASRWGCRLGGAGRTRWVYSRPEHEGAVYEHLRRHLPSSFRLAHAETLFPAGSEMRRKIGSLVVIAAGESSLTMPGYRYDHGSWMDDEMYVPFSVWGAEPG